MMPSRYQNPSLRSLRAQWVCAGGWGCMHGKVRADGQGLDAACVVWKWVLVAPHGNAGCLRLQPISLRQTIEEPQMGGQSLSLWGD